MSDFQGREFLKHGFHNSNNTENKKMVTRSIISYFIVLQLSRDRVCQKLGTVCIIKLYTGVGIMTTTIFLQDGMKLY